MNLEAAKEKLQSIEDEITFISQIEEIALELETSPLQDLIYVERQYNFYKSLYEKQLIEEELKASEISINNLKKRLEMILKYVKIQFEDKQEKEKKNIFLETFLFDIQKIRINPENKKQFQDILQLLGTIYDLVEFKQQKQIIQYVLQSQNISLDNLQKMFIQDEELNQNYDILLNYLQVIIDQFQPIIAALLDFFFHFLVKKLFSEQIQANENRILFLEILQDFQKKNHVFWMEYLLSKKELAELLSFEQQIIKAKINEKQELQDQVKTFCIIYDKLYQKYEHIQQKGFKETIQQAYYEIFKLFLNFIYEDFQEQFNKKPIKIVQDFYLIIKSLKIILQQMKDQKDQLVLLKKFKKEHILCELKTISSEIIQKIYKFVSQEETQITQKEILDLFSQFEDEKLQTKQYKNLVSTFMERYLQEEKFRKNAYIKPIISQISYFLPDSLEEKNSLLHLL